jgi:DNA-binding response OmpR family regulator
MMTRILYLRASMPAASQPGQKIPHLLIVEDDQDIVDLIQRYFSSQGFEVSAAADGMAMRTIVESRNVDVVLLDLGLPGEDGFSLTRYLREHWKGALIIVTGRGDSIDRVVGLELGADDYVTKPFDLRELLARVRSVLRRAADPSPKASAAVETVRFGGFRMNLGSRTLVDPRGQDVALTTGEFELLWAFVAQPNRVLSRDDLMNRIHGRDAGPYDRAIDVQIGRLRRKIETEPGLPSMIKSVRGAGYLFTLPVERR